MKYLNLRIRNQAHGNNAYHANRANIYDDNEFIFRTLDTQAKINPY